LIRTDNIKNFITDETARFTNKRAAIGILGSLLSGVYLVDVNTGTVIEGEYGSKSFMGTEIYCVLKALGVKTIPLDVLESFTNEDIEETEDIQIKDLSSISTVDQAKGLITELFDGVTYIDGETEVINVCYGDSPQSFGTIKSVFGDDSTVESFIIELECYWINGLTETKKLVDKFVALLLEQ